MSWVGVSRWLSTSLTVAFLSLSVGCGERAKDENAVPGPSARDGLLDLHDLLKEVAAENRSVPKQMADLTPHEPIHPAATAYIQNRSVVYFWGNGIQSDATGSGSSVIAHEAQAASQGGWVLLQDGTVKQMTADEFKAAPKPKATR